jgi:hypothetical protein
MGRGGTSGLITDDSEAFRLDNLGVCDSWRSMSHRKSFFTFQVETWSPLVVDKQTDTCM